MICIQGARRSLLAIFATGLALACTEGPSGNSGSIQVTVNPAALSVQQGGTNSVTATLIRAGGFDGAVTLAISGLPAGVTTTISPAQLSGTTASATVDVVAAATVAVGTYTATINASAQGVGAATTTFQLTVTAAPEYALTVTPATLTIAAGASGTATVNINRTNFSGGVALALLNPTTGITGVFTPATSTTNTSELVVTVAGNVAPGSYAVTIQGTAAGAGVRSTTLTVTVPAPPAAYTINLNPATASVPQGGSVVVNIALARTNFTGAIQLTFENPPPGITGTLVPANTTANASVFTLNVGISVPIGVYQLSLRGSAPGLTDRIASLQLTVTPAAGGNNVEYQFCDAAQAPLFFAYQDGTGAWQAVTGTASGGVTRFGFNLTQGRGGALAVFLTSTASARSRQTASRTSSVQPRMTTRARLRDRLRASFSARPTSSTPNQSSFADVYLTEVRYGTTAELAQDGADNCALTQATKTVTATVAGIPMDAFGVLSLGNSTDLFIGGLSTNPVTFTGVQPGPVDFVGTRTLTPGSAPDRFIITRNLNIPDGGSFPSTVDFNGPAALAPATANVTVTGAGGHDLEAYTELVTETTYALMWSDLEPSPATTRPWAGLSAGAMMSTDLHALLVFASSPSNDMDFRVTLRFVGPVTDQSLAMGPLLSEPTRTQIATGAYPRFRFQGTLPGEYNKGISIDLLGVEGEGNVYSLTASGAFLAASGSALVYDLTMPDVTGLSGFPVASRLTAGSNDVGVGGFGFTGSGVFDVRPSLGSEFKAAVRSSTIVVQ
jgi:hypothetical protein